jgi:hypothetical protein
MADDPGGLVYGTMLVATLLAAESPGRETYGETAGAVALAVVIYWLAKSYSAFAGRRARAGEAFTLSGARAALVHELSVLVGASVPLAAVLVCWAAGAGLAAGVWVAVAVAIATIVVTELAIGLRSEHTGGDLILRVALGMSFGIAILGIKLLLH